MFFDHSNTKSENTIEVSIHMSPGTFEIIASGETQSKVWGFLVLFSPGNLWHLSNWLSTFLLSHLSHSAYSHQTVLDMGKRGTG